jgi:hypothetical protein
MDAVAGSPAILSAVYDDTAGRVALTVTTAPTGAVSVYFQRSGDRVTWSDVRGGQSITVAGGAASLFDFEYAAGVTNYYRASYVDVAGNSIGPSTTTSVVPIQTGCWLKNPLRPFLNRKVTVIGIGDVTRQSRSGLFDIIGRTLPVAVTDLMSGRSTMLTIRATDPAEAVDVDDMVAVGEVLFLQPPLGSAVPTMYALPGGATAQRVANTSSARYLPVGLTECAIPDLTLAAVQSTWQTVVNTYATWADLIAAKATWSDVLQLVGSAEDVITS